MPWLCHGISVTLNTIHNSGCETRVCLHTISRVHGQAWRGAEFNLPRQGPCLAIAALLVFLAGLSLNT
jgi:hypothetical protein